MMKKGIYETLISSNHNGWAYWDKPFDDQIENRFSFEKDSNKLKPNILFLGLNASKKLEYRNFHNPRHKNDHKLMNAIQGKDFYSPKLPSLFGGFMTDLVHDQTGANSNKIEIKNKHFEEIEEKLNLLG